MGENDAKQRLEFLWQGRCQGDQKLVALGHRRWPWEMEQKAGGVVITICKVIYIHIFLINNYLYIYIFLINNYLYIYTYF